MKKNLEVLGVDETKEGIPLNTKAGKPYFRVKTSGLEGTETKWLSCFDMKMLDLIKSFIGKVASFEIRVSGNFANIDKCYGRAEGEDIEVIRPEKAPLETKGSKEFHLSIEECRARALECAIKAASSFELEDNALKGLTLNYFTWIWEGNQ